MYIEKRKTKLGIKYYLSHSFRYFGKVKKITVYLGKDLTKKELEKIKFEAEDKIKNKISKFQKANDPFYTEVKFNKNSLKDIEIPVKIFHLSESEWDKFARLFTYHTNAIEGSTLSKEEVDKVLKGKKIIADKNDIWEAIGLRKAIEWVRKEKPDVSVKTIKKLHKITFQKSKSFSGKLRKVDVVIMDGYGQIVHRGIEWKNVNKKLQELTEWYNKNRNEYHPIVLTAIFHNRFEEIHPFQDGNGRVGRLLLNLILIKNKFPPINIDFEKRSQYYKALQAYSKKRDTKPMIRFIIKEYKQLQKKLK